ncbi:FprA family A-type flavoprotein [Clostridium formicaceticum]|uniref:Flavo-diiron protein FprA1 n=1 Tax=Clostridium formicaceticum TaxID=1497 RepID=A0AAC9WI64_9CLOT|nr:FprA family A-type flavoprotein [Clostridium formicaceticum]AOY75040.1 MBL fold metallo-hydrolase [Clostridium formicaceticum]ARE89459.1 Flavo-diiron protein FprA1 [Clostridium formicaceticum]
MNAFEIKNKIYWTGVLDPDLETFDIIMKTPYGSTYNSYFIDDEKKVLIDTVKTNFKNEYLEKLQTLTNIKEIDYIIIQHTEPDHAGSLKYILEINPDVEVFCTKAASIFLQEQINKEFKYHVIKDGETLGIGSRKLTFITAPFLHWSDTMFTYSAADAILFSCDSFGSHYCAMTPETVHKAEYDEALQHYYKCIMEPFAQHVLNAYEKIKNLSISTILTSHGPILSAKSQETIQKYVQWSTEELSTRNQKQVAVFYLSAYKNTEIMAEKIKYGLKAAGVDVAFIDAEKESLERIHYFVNTSKGILLGSPTINKTMVKPMWELLSLIDPMANIGKVAGVFGSYGWSGEGLEMAYTLLKQMAFKLPFEPLSKKFTPSEDTLQQCFEFGKAFAEKI